MAAFARDPPSSSGDQHSNGGHARPSTADSSRRSTPTHPHRLTDVFLPRSPSTSPSLSSVSASDEELAYQDHWEKTGFRREWQTSAEGSAQVDSLPTELLIHIFHLLPSQADLVSVMMVSKAWCVSACPLIWQRPSFSNVTQFAHFVRAVSTPEPLLPYAESVRRLVFNGFARDLTDELLLGITVCKHLERLTLPGADVSSSCLINVLMRLPELVSIDISGISSVDDNVVAQIAASCILVQGLNLSKCKQVGDAGITALAMRMKMLRRIKLNGCHRVTDRSIIDLVRSCPLLLELDLANIPQLSDDTTIAVFLSMANLRELKMNENDNLSDRAIPNLSHVAKLTGEELFQHAGAYPWYLAGVPSPKAVMSSTPPPLHFDFANLRPVTLSFDLLRVVDFTSCASLTDESIENLTSNAPYLRNVTLAKCELLTDNAVISITKLGKFLHWLHLGHLKGITDSSITRLARTCTRLRYIDVGNCELLTDLSVAALASNLPKLRRIGLVKVKDITDIGIIPLAERFQTLERIHLSYCDKISVAAVRFLLNRLPLLHHLSLTGISPFRTAEFQQFSRSPPKNYNDHQRATFCVYSGRGVTALRDYLNGQADIEERLRGRGTASLPPQPTTVRTALVPADIPTSPIQLPQHSAQHHANTSIAPRARRRPLPHPPMTARQFAESLRPTALAGMELEGQATSSQPVDLANYDESTPSSLSSSSRTSPSTRNGYLGMLRGFVQTSLSEAGPAPGVGGQDADLEEQTYGGSQRT